MSAYWIGRAQTRDPDGYKEYGRIRAEAAKLFPQETLVRAGRYKVLEGPDDIDRFVLIRFPSMDAAIEYYNSPLYQQAAAIRRAASAQCSLTIVEGV